MKGKRVVITGPTSGIGKEIAFGLGALGASLVLGCRDVEMGHKVAEEISERTGAENIKVMRIDTSSRQSILEFAHAFKAKYSRLDVLINNAALNRAQRHLNADGIELTFATNVLGYFSLTRELLPLLQAGHSARIINVASAFAGDLDLEDLQFERRAYEGPKAYAQSKACDRMLTWAFARRLNDTSVTANAMTPGLVAETGLYRDTRAEIVNRLRKISQRSSAAGADTAVWLASSPEVEGESGKFFEERQVVKCEFRNEKNEEKLWSICEGLTEEKGSRGDAG